MDFKMRDENFVAHFVDSSLILISFAQCIEILIEMQKICHTHVNGHMLMTYC